MIYSFSILHVALHITDVKIAKLKQIGDQRAAYLHTVFTTGSIMVYITQTREGVDAVCAGPRI